MRNKAIKSLNSTVYYLDGVMMVGRGSLPTEQEIQDEIVRLEEEYAATQYSRDRAEAYPSLTEQADMAYWDRQNGTTTLDDAISAVKTTHPKPGEQL